MSSTIATRDGPFFVSEKLILDLQRAAFRTEAVLGAMPQGVQNLPLVARAAA